MISVVVPTMWKYLPFLDFIKDIVTVDTVSELIIIDNAPDVTPKNDILDHKKVNMISFGKNIFVNPAWNYGVNISKSDIVCILNDDLTFDLRLFGKIVDFMTPEIGVIGLSEGRVEYGQTPITTGSIDFEPFVNQSCFGFGELMFVHKKHWRDIPEGLDIGFGDNFIFDQYLFSGRQNYFITNMNHYHAVSQTVNSMSSEFRQILYNKERALYEQIKHKLYHREY